MEDLAAAEAFFNGKLGMEVTLRTYPGALFFAWDGYHHHVGANTWAGRRKAPLGPRGFWATLSSPLPAFPPGSTPTPPGPWPGS